MKKRVVVGLSGGVDSSVSAYLLKEQGYEVIGLFMKNWHDETVTLESECPWIEDSNDALLVAQKLDIPFQTVDLSKEYKERIVDYMFSEYQAGRTPNPDVLCNREIKFDAFLKVALSLGADYVATGHYCQKATTTDQETNKTIHHLIAGADNNKDQSYFLCQLNQDQLSKAVFPIGHLQKSKVREIAAEQDLITANKKDSQGLCFVGKIKLPEFLQQQLKPKKGNVIKVESSDVVYNEADLEAKCKNHKFKDLPNNKVVGEHNGAHYYTVGQRKGLGIGGTVEPLFVIGIDTEENIVYVGESNTHQGLNRKGLKIDASDVHWVNPEHQQNKDKKDYLVRIRYRQTLENATLHFSNDDVFIEFENNQKGVAPGQFATWYSTDNELVGSGVISVY